MGNRRGFSLIELLLVLTLSPVVFLSVYTNFSTGIRLWQRLQSPVPEENIAIFSEKIRHEIASALRYSPMPFSGNSEELRFCAPAEAPSELGADRGFGRVRYYYDASKKALFRAYSDLSQAYQAREGSPQRLLEGVGGFDIEYQIYDKLSEGYRWADAFEPGAPGAMPYAVRFHFEYAPSGRVVTQTFVIGAGGTFE